MCIICVSNVGSKQPSEAIIRNMFHRNPHGAGYMYARNGKVHIHKGFMHIEDFLECVEAENFTDKDAVVYHFRISTQAGVTPEMTHPFPLSNRRAHMKALDIDCKCGIAHNGVIRRTTDPTNREYSDTAIFITDYLTRIIHGPRDLRNPHILQTIEWLAGSKLAILDASGYIATIGDFISDDGILYSNTSYKAPEFSWPHAARRS